MRCSWRLVLGAIVGKAIVAAAQPAPPPPARSVPLLVIDAPSTFDATRLASALDTYVPDARLVVTAVSAAGTCVDALAAARAAGSPIGLWLHWTAAGALEIDRVGAAGCAAVTASTVDVPPEQAAFVYRVVALKVASLVRELPAVVPTPPSPPSPPPGAWRAIDLGASGIADPDAAGRGYFASAAAWFGRTWQLGGDVRASLARDATGPGGSGRARSFGVFAGVRRAVVESDAWSIDVALELGAISVHGSATRTAQATAMTDDVWTPAAALAPRIRFALVGPLAIALGPTLELAARPVALDLGVSPLYQAGRVRLRGDVNLELRF